jgi:uncharacterized protein (TIRG00374 family)
LSTAVRTVLVTALAIGLLAFFIRNADFSRVLTEMRAARPEWLAASVVLTIAMYFVRAERWQYLLEPLGPTRFWVAFKTTVIGFAATSALPARVGEVLRPYLLAKQEGLPFTATLATIVIERILDLAAVLMLLAVFMSLSADDAARAAPTLFRAIAIGAAAMGVVVVVVLALMFAMAGHPERLHALVLRAERVLPGRIARMIANLTRTFAEGLSVVRRPARLIASLGWSVVLWVMISAQAWLVGQAFGISLSFIGAFLLTSMLVVGVALPTPGGIGGAHEAFRLGTTAFFGANNDTAVGAAIVWHALSIAPVILGGAWFAMRDGLTMGSLRTMAADAPRQEGAAPLSRLRSEQ